MAFSAIGNIFNSNAQLFIQTAVPGLKSGFITATTLLTSQVALTVLALTLLFTATFFGALYAMNAWTPRPTEQPHVTPSRQRVAFRVRTRTPRNTPFKKSQAKRRHKTQEPQPTRSAPERPSQNPSPKTRLSNADIALASLGRSIHEIRESITARLPSFF